MGAAGKAWAGLLLAVVLIGALPGVLYLLGLASVHALPQPAAVAPTHRAACDDTPRDGVEAMNPWGHTVELLTHSMKKIAPVHREASWVAARHLMRGPRMRMGQWHLANAALTTWITRHWTATQIADTARLEEFCQVRNRPSAAAARTSG